MTNRIAYTTTTGIPTKIEIDAVKVVQRSSMMSAMRNMHFSAEDQKNQEDAAT